jgi:antitoxin component of MazEF toxin-antitoxin module
MQFVATIAHQGEMRVIVIPKRLHGKVSVFEGEQVKISIEKI